MTNYYINLSYITYYRNAYIVHIPNYPIERLHNNLRARTKTFRGFHGSLESAKAIMQGWSVYYNFVTEHQTINCSPYELATDLELKEKNKWLELIRLSNNSR